MAIPQFKIVMVGGGGVGKSAFLERHISGGFRKHYQPTLGVEVHPMLFHTNYGPIKLNIWDCAGQEKFGGLRDGYYLQADGAIVMFAVDSKLSHREVPFWYRDVSRVAPSIPTVICGNKVDLPERQVKIRDTTIHHKLVDASGEPIPAAYYELSAKSNHNFEKPILWLGRQLMGHEDLRFVETPELTLPTDPSELPLSEEGMLAAL